MTTKQTFTDNALDLSFYVQPGRRHNKPFDGKLVELVPYLSADDAVALDKARRELGEDPDNESAFGMVCQVIAKGALFSNLDFDVTDAAAWMGAPPGLLFEVMNELLGIEPPKSESDE